MKRLWIGLGLLVGILAVSLWTGSRLGEIHNSVSEDLVRCGRAAEAGEWAGADAFADRACHRWEDTWHFSAALADHTVLDEIDGLFAQMEVFRKSRDGVACAALCAQLAQAVSALQEGHKLSWWNLL